MRTQRNLPYMNAFGTVNIESAKSIDDALNLAGLDWNVESKSIYDENQNEIPGYKSNVRDVDNKLLGIVSNRYQIMQNKDAFNFVDALSNEGGFKFKAAGEFRNGKSIWVMGELPKIDILGDDISNNIVFTNSHDGTSGVKIMMTPIRLICSNMINFATKSADRIWKTKHTTNIQTKLEEAKYTLGLANEYIDALKEEADKLVNVTITDSQIEAIFDKLFPVDIANDSNRKISNIAVMKNNFLECYNEEDIKQFRGTGWGAVNAMADLLDHKDPSRASKNYYENNWYRLINGHDVLDSFHREVLR